MLLGNSGAPRWYDLDRARFEVYLDRLREWGATSTEIVLHHGPFDERTARVHVVEPDWGWVIPRYRESGLAVQLHVSLDPRFSTSRWLREPDRLRAEYRPLLRVARELARDQGRVVLVVHGASAPAASRAENRLATIGLLRWLAHEIAGMPGEVVAALELRAARADRPMAAAASRADVLEIVREVGSPRVGICWDLAHDAENASVEPGWRPVPDAEFLRQVVHVHLHDLDARGEAHYPLVLGRVPFPEQLGALAAAGARPSVTMEVRWRCAARLGEPWELLERSYRVARSALAEVALSRTRA